MYNPWIGGEPPLGWTSNSGNMPGTPGTSYYSPGPTINSTRIPPWAVNRNTGSPNNRTSFGTVTHLYEYHGFINGDVHFNKRCAPPQIKMKDKVRVESVMKDQRWVVTKVEIVSHDEHDSKGKGGSKRHKGSMEETAVSKPANKQQREKQYEVTVPGLLLTETEVDVLTLKKEYIFMHVPSEFFCAKLNWQKTFAMNEPFAFDVPCIFHIMDKKCKMPTPISEEEQKGPADANYAYSAKVMLLNLPQDTELYRKCLVLAEDGDKNKELASVMKCIQVLIGKRNKNEVMAIGGPWSPSLDGLDPEYDSNVLIRTAIRTCKGMTGIDLTNVKKWNSFVDVKYHREKSVYKGREYPAYVETVRLFLPDLTGSIPTASEWEIIVSNYTELAEIEIEGSGAEEKILKEQGMKVDGGEGFLQEGNEMAVDTPKKALTEEEKEAIRKRYHIPHTPCILVHPSSIVKQGKFDCSVTNMEHLLKYSLEDVKEHSFEVFLFVELFHCMLQRNFGYNIYKELCLIRNKEQEAKKVGELEETAKQGDGDEKLTMEGKKDGKVKKEDKTADKKKEEKNLMTIRPNLLLSFAYFDCNGVGYIKRDDMAEIIQSLGSFSKKQVKDILENVTTTHDGKVEYRKFTDKPAGQEQEMPSEDVIPSLGNKFVPIVKDELMDKSNVVQAKDKDGSFFASKDGCVINIKQLRHSVEIRADEISELGEMLTSISHENKEMEDKTKQLTQLILEHEELVRNLGEETDIYDKDIRKLKIKALGYEGGLINMEKDAMETRKKFDDPNDKMVKKD